MTVGVLLMTHESVGKALISAARHVMPTLPMQVDAVEVPPQADTDVMRSLTARHARELDRGDGVLILADLYGATPCNIAQRLSEHRARLRWVAGLNLPMLLRVLNYAGRPLDELTEIAVSGGHTGIRIDHLPC